MKLKVCGMKYQENMNQVAALQPDYLGFIFYEKSTRFFQNDMPQLPEHIKKVGVFVNNTIEVIIENVKKHNLHAIQLHGDELPEFCLSLKNYFKQIEIIKVFSIKDKFNFDSLKPYENVCDHFLFDTKGKLPGGNGYAFDWTILNKYPSTKPFFLSGGIGLEQLENIKQFQESKAAKYCHALDVNSQFELEPGLKNIEKIEEFKSLL